MEVIETKDGVLLRDVTCFDAAQTFECGQCFRWKRQEDGSYTGVAMGRVLNVKSSESDHTVILKNTNLEEFEGVWRSYFDLDRDYGQIQKTLGQDEVMSKAIVFGQGIRLLRQEPWETLISFIISANNNIPRISGCVQLLCEAFGQRIEFEGKPYYTFPTPENLAACGMEGISLCRAGYRCRYIHEVVGQLQNSGMALDGIRDMPVEQARAQLLRFTGVGPKVADCILLFSMQKFEVYPMDVWVKRVTEHFYFQREVGMKEIQTFARDKFGGLAGFAQQYLFYYARENM